LNGPVVDGDNLHAVERDADCVSLDPGTEMLRLGRDDRNIGAGNLPPDAFDDVIKVDVVFERIGTCNVIVVRILDPEYQTGRRSICPAIGVNDTPSSTSLALTVSITQSGNRLSTLSRLVSASPALL